MTGQDIETFFAILDNGTMTAAAERTFYLITPRGRGLTAPAELLLEDMRRHVAAVDGITLF